MELNEKLQFLRKKKGLTQEELAQALYVSRTAVSKWESGRGYPNIDSLKAIADFFSVTIDDLLSREVIFTSVATVQESAKPNSHALRFGALDASCIFLLFLPLWGMIGTDGHADAVTLWGLSSITPYLKTIHFVSVFCMTAFGVLSLALQNCQHSLWTQYKTRFSVAIHSSVLFLCIASRQPYASSFLFLLLLIKIVLLVKKR